MFFKPYLMALLRLAKTRLRQICGVLLTLFCCAVITGWVSVGFVAQLDRWWHDARLAVSLPAKPAIQPSVVIIDIDERSLAQLGHWPWPRSTLASLVETLSGHYRVSVIGFDVVFAERAVNPVLPGMQQLAKLYPALAPELAALLAVADEDAVFARALAKAPVVLGYYFDTAGAARHSGTLPAPVFDAELAGATRPLPADGYAANVSLLQQAAGAGGHFNALPDSDGVNRRMPVLVENQGQLYETLSVAMLRRLQGNVPLLPEFDTSGLMRGVSVGSVFIPLDTQGAMLIPYVGPRATFRYVSAVDVLQRTLPLSALAGKAVLVGATAPGLMDLRATPLDAVYPGVEIHANALNAVLQGKLYHAPDNRGAEAIAVFVLGCLLAWRLPRMSPVLGMWLTVLCIALVMGGSVYAWQRAQLALPVAAEVLLLASLYLLNISWGYISEARRRRELASAFGSYVPPELVSKMSDAPAAFLQQMKGEHRHLSVLFSDVRDFTRVSEGLPAAELASLMNRYLSAQTTHIQHTRGTIDKYIGDAIMAFWGAPMADEQHARHAIASALAMQKGMAGLNAAFAERGWPALRIGIGINSGDMTVGNMGSDFRRAYTVMGDAVNLAARLEGLTKQYDVPILCGEGTRQACPDLIWREVDRIRAKGKQQAVTVWQPMAEEDGPPSWQAPWQAVLQAYRAADFAGAAVRLAPLLARYPDDGLYKVYQQRIEHYLAVPPDRWDGVFEQTEK